MLANTMISDRTTPNQANAAIRKEFLRQVGGHIGENRQIKLPKDQHGVHTGIYEINNDTKKITIEVYISFNGDNSIGPERVLPEKARILREMYVIDYRIIEKPKYDFNKS